MTGHSSWPFACLGIRLRGYQGNRLPARCDFRSMFISTLQRSLAAQLFGSVDSQPLIVLVNKRPCGVNSISCFFSCRRTFACFDAPQVLPCQVLLYVTKSLFFAHQSVHIVCCTCSSGVSSHVHLGQTDREPQDCVPGQLLGAIGLVRDRPSTPALRYPEAQVVHTEYPQTCTNLTRDCTVCTFSSQTPSKNLPTANSAQNTLSDPACPAIQPQDWL